VDNNNPPPIPAPVDPLSAISAEDKILLENCRNKLMGTVAVLVTGHPEYIIEYFGIYKSKTYD